MDKPIVELGKGEERKGGEQIVSCLKSGDITLNECDSRLKFNLPECAKCRPEYQEEHELFKSKDNLISSAVLINHHDKKLTVHAIKNILDKSSVILRAQGKTIHDALLKLPTEQYKEFHPYAMITLMFNEFFREVVKDSIFDLDEIAELKRLTKDMLVFSFEACKKTCDEANPVELDRQLEQIKEALK